MAKFEELGSLLFPAGKVAEEVQQGESARRRFAAVNDDGTFSVIDVYVYVTNEFADEDRDDAFWDYEVQTRSVVTDSLDSLGGATIDTEANSEKEWPSVPGFETPAKAWDAALNYLYALDASRDF